MSLQQGKLFPKAEALKLRECRRPRMTRSYFDRLWKKGYDPAYLIKLTADDIPSLAEFQRKKSDLDPKTGLGFSCAKVKAVILSKGPHDQNRRIVAEDAGAWITGLYIALLQRQVREGIQFVQGRCYAMLINLELDKGWQHVVDKWTTDLVSKRKV